LLNSYTLNNDGHKAVINTAKFATLSEKSTTAIDKKADLIDAARAGIHFYTKRGNSSAVKNIGGGNKNTDVCTDRKLKAIINLKKAKGAFRKIRFKEHVAVEIYILRS